MSLYKDQFLEKHDLEKTSPTKFLIIASTPRCGSHMLGHALHETNQFGFPLEYVNPDNLKEWKKQFNCEDLNEVIEGIKSIRTSSNGVFGIKIHYSHIKEFGGFDKLLAHFPDAYYVLLSRKDVLKQAVSFAIACQTGVWISGQEASNENTEYNFDLIDACLKSTINDNASWRYTLSASGSNYIELDFDFVRKNLSTSIQKIADFMEVNIDIDVMPQQHVTKKQTNSINSAWTSQFLSEFNHSKELLNVYQPNFLHKLKRKVKEAVL